MHERIGTVKKKRFPTGRCADGALLETSRKTIWFDTGRRLVRFRRKYTCTLPSGEVFSEEVMQQKHPVSAIEVKSWLEKHDFIIEKFMGDHAGNPYAENSPRAIFWARKGNAG